MNSKFAKIFDDTQYGQILVKLDSNKYGEPEIKFYFQRKTRDVYSIISSFTGENTEEQWENAEKVLSAMNEEKATEAIAKIEVIDEYMN